VYACLLLKACYNRSKNEGKNLNQRSLFLLRKEASFMNCRGCGAPMTLDDQKIIYQCDYCTSTYFPEESRDGIRSTDIESSHSCPVCRIPLHLAYIEKIQVKYCGRCRGVLIQKPRFLYALNYIRSKARGEEITPRPLRREELERKVLCPECGNKMDTHPYGGPGNIVIDSCPCCMLNWLDQEELYRVTRAPGGPRGMDIVVDYDKLFRGRKKDG
jgi:Zn-finger nucleic acid-binding protein